MKKFVFIFLATAFYLKASAQGCEKGCARITKTEPTTNKKIKADRALLIFKFYGPGGKPAKSFIKIIVDKDTIVPVIDKTGSTKITAKPGLHKLKFKALWWYTVKMSEVNLSAQKTYSILVKFEAEEIGAGKLKDVD